MILILSTPDDEHAQRVMGELGRLDAPARLIDLSEFPQNLGITVSIAAGAQQLVLGCKSSGLDLARVASVWWRRPQAPVLDPRVRRQSHRVFAANECQEALHGLWQSLNVFWMNDPASDAAAHRKLHQLQVAQRVGLAIPDTLITSCDCAARDFIGSRPAGSVILKSFSATPDEWRETRIVGNAELAVLDAVRLAPVIFQSYIPAVYDLRITIVGQEVFAAAIHSQETAYAVDCRMDIANARIEPVALPDSVVAALQALMKALHLQYGAVDMRLTPDGQYVFLEINPAGQWLFIEHATGQPISEAVGRALARPAAPLVVC